MSRTRSAAVALLVASFLVMTCSAEAAPASGGWASRLLGHSYANGNHHASGRVRMWLPKASGRKHVSVRCHVIMQWDRKGNDGKRTFRTDYVTARVVTGHPSVRHFNIKLRDPHHLFKNMPSKWDTGCPSTRRQ